MKIRCSSLPKIMVSSRSKDGGLSETAKSYIKSIAKQDYFGYTTELNNKYVTKGIQCEEQSIELLNDVLFTNYEKNTERKTTEILTGECDIYTPDLIIDIKTSWSFDTFPATPSDINIKDYEYQLRGYMHLYGVERAALAYCMVNTPSDLIGYESEDLHRVRDTPIQSLVTMLTIERDLELEKEMLERSAAAIEYYQQYINQIHEKKYN
jgi:hypothetical protein